MTIMVAQQVKPQLVEPTSQIYLWASCSSGYSVFHLDACWWPGSKRWQLKNLNCCSLCGIPRRSSWLLVPGTCFKHGPNLSFVEWTNEWMIFIPLPLLLSLAFQRKIHLENRDNFSVFSVEFSGLSDHFQQVNLTHQMVCNKQYWIFRGGRTKKILVCKNRSGRSKCHSTTLNSSYLKKTV